MIKSDKANKYNRKNIIIVLLCLMIAGFTVFLLFGQKIEDSLHDWINRNDPAENEEVASEAVSAVKEYYEHPESEGADAAYSCDGLYFYGDTGYLVKGELLDQSVKSAYDNLPDTVGFIRYGDQIEQVEQKDIDFYNKKARFKLLKSAGENAPITTYLKLAEQGKVAYLKLMPNQQGSLELEDQCDFRSRYADYFDPKITEQRNTPLAVKEVLVEYFKTDEGKDYRFVNDRRKTEQVYHIGSFTGLNQYTQRPSRELAVILTEKNSTGTIRERIMVIGYDDVNWKGTILFNEIFYGNKLLVNAYDNPRNLPQEAFSLGKHVTPSRQLIEVKINSGSSIYLYYDADFDTMVRKSFSQDSEERDCGEC